MGGYRVKLGKLQLKTVFYLSFLCFIVLPILVVLVGVLNMLNQQFKNQAIENIERAQETIVTELNSNIQVTSMRLSHLIHTNNNEVLDYAAGTDTTDWKQRYYYENKLNQAGSLALEPVTNIVSVGFYMKDQKITYYKNDIKKSFGEICRTKWYRSALGKKNQIFIGFMNPQSTNELYSGGKKDSLILVFALAPDVKIDRSGKIEMVAFYQSSVTANKIKEYNREYQQGGNTLGNMKIISAEGDVIYEVNEAGTTVCEEGATCIETPLDLNIDTWYVHSDIKTSELTSDFWKVAKWVLLVAVIMLLLVGYYSSYFLRSIVRPIQVINTGLRKVEEGELQIHITPSGQYEIRTMIHSFNAMVRRLQALITEYEEKVRSSEKSLDDYFIMMLDGKLTPEQVNKKSKYFFEDSYAILSLSINKMSEIDSKLMEKLEHSFARNPRYSSRCVGSLENSYHLLAFYRISEEEYVTSTITMLHELQRIAVDEYCVDVSVCISKIQKNHTTFYEAIGQVKRGRELRFLKGKQGIIDWNMEEEQGERILQMAEQYKALATALYIADERNGMQEKERIFEQFNSAGLQEGKIRILAVVYSVAKLFSSNNINFYDLFGEQINYYEKLERIQEIRSLKVWLTNYIDWIMEYSAEKLCEKETDTIIKAKRYVNNHYENPNLSLGEIAKYVELNDKYFTSKFSKETGETFINYLTGLRMQKAKELLKTTNFKIYEIAEMVGYRNVENFNRVFKKNMGVSPVQYRKTM